MFRWPWRRKPALPTLPEGLRWCEVCGEPRGRTPDGRVSACWCSGLICNRCDERIRRPISDFYDAGGPSGRWWHVSWFEAQGHTFACARTHPEATGFVTLEPDPDVRAYQEAMTRRSLAEMDRNREARDALDDDGPTIQFGPMPGIVRLPPEGS
jgi:hypothetical protein